MLRAVASVVVILAVSLVCAARGWGGVSRHFGRRWYPPHVRRSPFWLSDCFHDLQPRDFLPRLEPANQFLGRV
jgi:hypothetical protein